MIIEDFFTRHTGDTSFFYLDMNAIVDISLTHFFLHRGNGNQIVEGGGGRLFLRISFIVECIHVFV